MAFAVPVFFCAQFGRRAARGLLLRLQNLSDLVIGSLEVETRFPIRRSRYRPSDVAAQRYELSPQFIPRIFKKRCWRSESREVDDRSRRHCRGVELQVDLRQILVLQCPPIRI